MKLFDFINSNNDKIINIYCDMDGVLCEYDIGNFNYDELRPMKTSINNIKKLHNYNNINIYILSICKTNNIRNDKIKWMNLNMPFLNNDNFIFISKEDIKDISSKEIKLDYLNNNIDNNINIVIDDDINVIKHLKNNKNLKIFHVSSIID